MLMKSIQQISGDTYISCLALILATRVCKAICVYVIKPYFINSLVALYLMFSPLISIEKNHTVIVKSLKLTPIFGQHRCCLSNFGIIYFK